ncbi:tail-completion protein [Vibrio phage 1.198.B._10N.286.54.F4]|nr:tail-completion protein [Vibrio phage 1.198.A._10N.286.54.F4]AUR94821.1 tail-completion protein [Vibrio phage 1.198.B._10N.286.54.F4]
MYLGFNTLVRSKLNDASFQYNSDELPIYFSGQWETDQGAHIRALVFSNEPDATEFGFNAAEEVTGFVQLGVFLPATDNGLDYSLNELASQVHSEFNRSSFSDGEYKVEWLNVQREPEIRIGGHYTVTLRVNYRYFYCN